jgi:hypothetical protein
MLEFLCPQCELRPVFHRRDTRYPGRHFANVCRECHEGNKCLAYYWAKIGMPLSWRASSRRREWSHAICQPESAV